MSKAINKNKLDKTRLRVQKIDERVINKKRRAKVKS